MNKQIFVDKIRPPLRGLYAITDGALISVHALVSRVEQVLQGGAALIQYRDKGLDVARRECEVRALLELCRQYQVPLIINDDVDLAQATGTDGVHLGREDPALIYAREKLGPHAIIGVSCYNSLELALQAQAGGADYVAFGAFFPSHTKPQARPADMNLLTQVKMQLHIPVAAIGGITPARGAELIAAGADLLAVVHGVFGQPDVLAAAQTYQQLFTSKG
ncbi:MAG: thiamine phosphate synthase [Gammaproteobacteria bacterium]